MKQKLIPSFPYRDRVLAIKVVNSAEHAKKRGEDRCPYCQTVWVSSIDFKERHDLECPLPEARQVLNDLASASGSPMDTELAHVLAHSANVLPQLIEAVRRQCDDIYHPDLLEALKIAEGKMETL